MTMPQQYPPPPLPPVKGWEFWFWQLSEVDKQEALQTFAERTVNLYKELRDLLRAAVAGHDLPPAERLLEHTDRPAQRWEMFRQLLPQEYDETQKDFHTLLERAHAEPVFAQQVEELRMKQEVERAAMAQAQAIQQGAQAA